MFLKNVYLFLGLVCIDLTFSKKITGGTRKCPANERFSCEDGCEATCYEPKSTAACSQVYGCYCDQDFIRENADGDCMKRTDCPALKPSAIAGSLIDNCVRSIAILYPKKLINDGVTKPSKDFVKNSRLIIKPIYVLLKPLLNTALAPIRLTLLPLQVFVQLNTDVTKYLAYVTNKMTVLTLQLLNPTFKAIGSDVKLTTDDVNRVLTKMVDRMIKYVEDALNKYDNVLNDIIDKFNKEIDWSENLEKSLAGIKPRNDIHDF